MKNKKVILNQSLLSSNDVAEFEYEAKMNVFFNMPPLDKRENELKSVKNQLKDLNGELTKFDEKLKKKEQMLSEKIAQSQTFLNLLRQTE